MPEVVLIWLAGLMTVVGLALTGSGLYRRDPEAQRWVATNIRRPTWRFIQRWILRRKRETVTAKGALFPGGGSLVGRGTVTPGQRKDGATTEERLIWLERAADLAFQQLKAEREYRRQDLDALRKRVGDLQQALSSNVTELRQRVEEFRAPQRMEWVGLAFVFVGAVLGLAAGISS
jgi:hypothetical protein